MPHLDYTADIESFESKLELLGLCNATEPSCVMDFPNIVQLSASMENLVDGGLEYAVELAKTAQPRSDILTSFSDGIVPDGMVLPSGSAMTIESGAVFSSDGEIHINTLTATNFDIEYLNVDTITSPVDFGNNLVSNVNIDTATTTFEGELLTANAAEINVLAGVNVNLTGAELSNLVGLDINPGDLNVLKGVDSDLGKEELDLLVGLTTNSTVLNQLNGLDPAVDATVLNALAGLQTSNDELNVFNNVSSDLSATELNMLVGLDINPQDLNVLKGVDPNLNKDHLNNIVGLNILPGDLNVLNGVDHSLGKDELNLLVGLTVDANTLNQLKYGTGETLATMVTSSEFNLINDIAVIGETEPNKAVTTDSSGDVVFKGNVEIDGNLDIPHGKLKLNGVTVSASVTADVINDAATHFGGLTATVDEINSALDGITATAAELNKLHQVTTTTAEMNRLDVTTAGQTEANKVVTTDSSGNVRFNSILSTTSTLNVDTLKIAGGTVTATSAELNKLDGVTATTADLNTLDITTLGESEANKVVTADSTNKVTFTGKVVIQDDFDIVKDKLKIGGVAVTTTAAELNVLDGISTDLTASEISTLNGVSSVTNDINLLSGVYAHGVRVEDVKMLAGVAADNTNTVADRVIVTDGSGNVNLPEINAQKVYLLKDKLHIDNVAVTTTAAELNLLDGVDTDLSVTEINTLNGLTATTAELNKLDGATVTTTDLNLLQGVSANANNAVANRIVRTDSNGNVNMKSLTVNEELKVGANKLKINDVAVTATAAEINILDGVTASTAELNKLTGITASAAEINTLDGITVSSDDINLLSGLHATRTNAAGDKLVVLKGDGNLDLPMTVTIDTLKATGFFIDGTEVTATATELNALDGMTSTAAELNLLDSLTSTADELNILDGATITTNDLNLLAGLHDTRTNAVGSKAVVFES